VADGSDGLIGPRGVGFGSDASLFVASFKTNQVLHYGGSTGAFLGTFVTADEGGLNLPRDLVFSRRSLPPRGLLACGLAALAAWKRKTRAKIHTPAPLTR
jgi:hypothetical protein